MRAEWKSYQGRVGGWPAQVWQGVLVISLVGMIQGHGQEALRTAIQADRSYEARQAPVTWPDDRLRAGPVRFDLGAGFSAEWNDNVNLSANDPRHDYILRPQMNARALWPVTDRMRLSLGAGIGYTVYLEGNRPDRLLLSPDSELAFDMRIKDVAITIYDRVDYSDDLVADAGAVSARDYARISNTVGVRATWSLYDWRLQAGYSHFDFWSLTDEFRYLNRASEQVFARVGYALAPGTQVGLEASGSITRYDQPERSDFSSLSVGPYVEWSLTEDLRLRLRGGYVRYDFEANPTRPDLGTVDSYYLGFTAEHRLTPFVSHRLGAAREVQVGIRSDYEEQFRVDYSVRWTVTDPASVSLGVWYRHSTEPGLAAEAGYHQAGASLGAQYRLTSRFTATAGYRFTRRESNVGGRDYTQNIVSLGAVYRF
jgi:predicted porin